MPSSDKPKKSREKQTKNHVITHDGHRAIPKPRVVVFGGADHEVTDCESLYISTGEKNDTPVKRGFLVRCKGGRQFKLEMTDGASWEITPIPGPKLI